ncbi:hypothetical protein J6590_001106 [Homalodisca vitripennis]|nr:hypothetical protein J6590_001106 [Homalodisca vitripennis]
MRQTTFPPVRLIQLPNTNSPWRTKKARLMTDLKIAREWPSMQGQHVPDVDKDDSYAAPTQLTEDVDTKQTNISCLLPTLCQHDASRPTNSGSIHRQRFII